MDKNRKAGRPAFQPDQRMRRLVASAAGTGNLHRDIAAGLGISRTTLLKYFPGELSTGACARRLEVIAAMFASAMKGRVTAQKGYLALWRRRQTQRS
jgi:hypothetical protein